MKKKGFEFFFSRPIHEEVDFSILEKACSIKLPPLYKLFVTCFKVGEDVLNLDFIGEKEFPINGCNFSGVAGFQPDNSFTGFFSVEEMLKFHEEHYLFSEDGSSLIRIGDTNVSAINLLLGIGKDNWDEIWVEDWDRGNSVENGGIRKQADNIFEFVRTLTNFEAEGNEGKYIKKWGDEYWQEVPAGAAAV